jgi:hypothetical protein
MSKAALLLRFLFLFSFAESLTRRGGWESQQDQAARAEKKKIFDALALASILHNSALESASKVGL